MTSWGKGEQSTEYTEISFVAALNHVVPLPGSGTCQILPLFSLLTRITKMGGKGGGLGFGDGVGFFCLFCFIYSVLVSC